MKKQILKTIAVMSSVAIMMASYGCTSKTAEPDPTADLTVGTAASPTSIDLSGYTYETVYGSQLNAFLDHQYYFDGQPIPLAESNFYFIDAFITLTNNASYGMYPSTSEGYIDLSAPITSEDSDYQNYGDFLVDYAEKMLESTYVIVSLANDAGLSLSEETQAEIDSTIASIQASSADPAGLTMEEYLQLYYGPNCTEETFRTIIENYKIADLYTLDYYDNYEFDDAEIYVPNVRYALISAPEGSTDEELAAAESAAQELLEASTDLDQFEIESALAYTNGIVYQTSTIAVEEGNLVEDFENWCLDEERQEGDIDVVYAPEYGYFVIGYLGTTEVAEETKESIAVSALGEYVTDLMDQGVYEFYTNDTYAPAETVAAVSTDSTLFDTSDLVADQTPARSPADIAMTLLAAVGGAAIITGIFAGGYYLATKNKKAEGADKSEEKKAKAKKVRKVDPDSIDNED